MSSTPCFQPTTFSVARKTRFVDKSEPDFSEPPVLKGVLVGRRGAPSTASPTRFLVERLGVPAKALIMGARFGPYEEEEGDPLDMLNNPLDCAGFCTVLLALKNQVRTCRLKPGHGVGMTSAGDATYLRYIGCAENRSNEIALTSRGQWVYADDPSVDRWLGLYHDGVKEGCLRDHVGYAQDDFNEELAASEVTDDLKNRWNGYGTWWSVYLDGKAIDGPFLNRRATTRTFFARD